ncbi:YbfB/YjiJ family MFS transporter [Salinisphaera sp. T31B1]|uniref:YbfB/YjiJ family MFS transporter n=1 Tax=Salinisphaera sp. T31B1 TaxID=727963 RepID=UPI0033425BFB
MSSAVRQRQGPLLVSGAIALLLGIGLGRYAFTPLIPSLVQAGWFSAEQTAELGAINLLGYLVGAATAHLMVRRLGPRAVIGGALAALTLSLLSCALPGGMIWYGPWRLIAGWAAATLTIVVTPIVMGRMPAARRPAASAIVFTGMGVGTITASLLVPLLAEAGIATTWIAVGVLGGVLAGWSWRAVWRHLPAGSAATNTQDGGSEPATPEPASWPVVTLIIVAYGLNSAGYVPHSLYWVDYIARELGRGLAVGNACWLALGVGGLLGPALGGYAAARLGFRAALIVAFLAMTAATALPLASSSLAALGVSSFMVGAMVPAIITLTAGTVVEIAPADRRQQIWGWATLSFAVAQTLGGFGMSALYASADSYRATIALGALLLCLGAGCVITAAVLGRQRTSPATR